MVYQNQMFMVIVLVMVYQITSGFATVHQITSVADYTSKLKGAGDKLVVLNFFTTECGPCRTMDSILEDYDATYGDSMLILKVDNDEREDVVKESNLQIRSVPTVVFIKNGETFEEVTGVNPSKLQRIIEKHTGLFE